MARKNDKRIRLIEAADTLFHRQGVNTTTLANIASLADVPLGNVYYYFKSKESIIMAVIEYRQRMINNLFDEWNKITDPKERLKSFINYGSTRVEEVVNYGDSLSSLCQELGKQSGIIASQASNLLHSLLTWSQKQFKAIGQTEDESSHSAANLLSSLQGVSLLALTFKDSTYISRQVGYLCRWVDRL